jgi:DNA-binding NtrC family response regulator
MITNSNGGYFHPDKPAEQPERSSPTQRVAAYYHSDIELVGRSQAFIEVIKQVDRVANTDQPVLLTGESVTGKELVASAIHQRSDRHDQPFVVVNCGAIPPELLESEVFGHEDQRGLFEEADGGTIFLDEITETTSSFQGELLRALQTQRVNVRVIAAGSRNLEQAVTAGRFCSDLFQRLNEVSITLPECTAQTTSASGNGGEWVTLSVIEGRYVARVLEHTGGNKQAAARVLAVDRKTLDRMIKRHHIDCHRVPRARAKASGHN